MKRTPKRSVSAKSVGQEIIEGLKEAIAFERGLLPNTRVDFVTARAVHVAPPPAIESGNIVKIRAKMGLSQVVFARTLNVNPETVRSWEQGKGSPGGAALRLLEISRERPDILVAKIAARQSLALASGPGPKTAIKAKKKK